MKKEDGMVFKFVVSRDMATLHLQFYKALSSTEFRPKLFI